MRPWVATLALAALLGGCALLKLDRQLGARSQHVVLIGPF